MYVRTTVCTLESNETPLIGQGFLLMVSGIHMAYIPHFLAAQYIGLNLSSWSQPTYSFLSSLWCAGKKKRDDRAATAEQPISKIHPGIIITAGRPAMQASRQAGLF